MTRDVTAMFGRSSVSALPLMQSAFVWAPKFGFDLEAGVREAIESCKGAGVEDSFLKSILLLCRSRDTVQIAVAVGMICESSHNVL